MTLKIIHKNNTSAGQAPAPSDLDAGEIAVNSADAELYTKDTNGNIRKFQNTTTGTADGVQFTQAGTGAVQRTVESKLQDVVSVLDFIPESERSAIKNGTSTYDATAAFNAALRASETYGDSLKHICLQLNGWHYYVLGTVYLRKGQVIEGGGSHLYMGSTGSIKVGFKSDNTQDPGGAPPGVHNLWIEGGLVPLRAEVSGYQISNIFITSPAAGPVFSGSDGCISDCIFDGGTLLCLLSGFNITMTNCNFYLGNSQLFISGCEDSVISNCLFNYANVSSIDWAGNGSSVNNVRIDNCSFAKNAQYSSTFKGFIYTYNLTTVPAGDLTVTNCSFRNCYKSAITNNGSGSHSLVFNNCEFNGTKTLSAYVQSTTMYALDMAGSGAGKGKTVLDGCRFVNLHDTPIKLASAEPLDVTITNCLFNNNAGITSISVGSCPSTASLTLGNCSGDTTSKVPLFDLGSNLNLKVVGYLKDWLKVIDDGVTYRYVEVPFAGACLVSAVLRANQIPAGSAEYRAFKKCTASISYDFTSVLATRATIQDDFKSYSPILGVDLSLQAAITDIATGASVAGFVKPGKLVLYWPRSYEFTTIDVQYELC